MLIIILHTFQKCAKHIQFIIVEDWENLQRLHLETKLKW